ncbi:rhodanese-like domain-containing protein [Candidatus Dependentiae bacterium]|nr:rhodanese-like domain-containing protein [Candidatus Dependentiae bacterium]
MNKKLVQAGSFGLLVIVLAVVPACGDWFKKDKNKDIATVANTENVKYGALNLIYLTNDKQFADAHIPGSVRMDLDQLEEKTQHWPKDIEIVTYCANYQCTASGEAVKKLHALGFTNVKVYEGGIAQWTQKAALNSSDYPVSGLGQAKWLKQEVDKSQPVDLTVQEITAEELSQKLKAQETHK